MSDWSSDGCSSDRAAAIGPTAAPPGAISRGTAASASCTGNPSRRSIAAAVDLPMPIEPVRPRISIAASGNQHPMGAQEVEQRQQRQTQDREVVALDRGEQLRPQPLELLGAAAGADFVADCLKIGAADPLRPAHPPPPPR